GPGSGVGDAELGATLAPEDGAVAVAVVGEDPLDRDALLGEPGDGTIEEGDAVGGVLGAGELAVREPAVGVDRGVDVGVAEPLLAHRPVAGAGPAELLVPAAWWHPGELLDVDVDQLAAAGGLDAAHRPPRRAAHPCQPVQPVTHQHPVHRRSRHPDDPGETCPAETAGLAQRDEAPLHPGRGLRRTRPRPAGTVLEPGESLVAIAAPPLVRALPGDVHRLRGSSDGPTRFDALTEPAAALHGEGSVTVQQGLLGSCVAFDSSTLTQGAHRSADVNNVPGHNTGPARSGQAARRVARPRDRAGPDRTGSLASGHFPLPTGPRRGSRPAGEGRWRGVVAGTRRGGARAARTRA